MLTTVLSAIVLGAVIGGLARLVLPGRQTISLLVTVILGVLGSLAGSWLAYRFGYSGADGFEWTPFFVGVAVAAGLIVLYGALTGRRQI
ncbi:MAG: GlsB/YeaQ/YmgE family stress response membrane protein [Intrasporangiaceae bacterium]|nr:GlsB/YeaQ/YmgE family stress response membrane protein [Intrasporangiaceae bacterium]